NWRESQNTITVLGRRIQHHLGTLLLRKPILGAQPRWPTPDNTGKAIPNPAVRHWFRTSPGRRAGEPAGSIPHTSARLVPANSFPPPTAGNPGGESDGYSLPPSKTPRKPDSGTR